MTKKSGSGGSGGMGTEIMYASADTKAKMYEPKQKKTMVRILTVVAYIFSVSLAAIILSLFYLFIYNPGKPGHHIGTTNHSPNQKLLERNHRGQGLPVNSTHVVREEPRALPLKTIHKPVPPKKTEGKLEGKLERKSERKSEGKSERTADEKSDEKSDGKSEGKLGGKSEGKLEGKSEEKSDGKLEGKSGEKSEGKSEGSSGGKSEEKSGGKSEGKSGGSSGGNSGEKSEGNSDGKLKWKSEEKAMLTVTEERNSIEEAGKADFIKRIVRTLSII